MFGLFAALLVLVAAGGVVAAFSAKPTPSVSLKERFNQWNVARKETQVIAGTRQEAQFIASPTRYENDLGIDELYELSEPGEGYLNPQVLLDNLSRTRAKL